MQWVSFGALVAAAGFTVHANASAGDIPMGLYLYCMAPYALAACFVMAPWGEQRAQEVSGSWIGFAFLAVTFLSWRDTSSTAGLIWLFLPIYLVVGGAIAWPLLYLVFKARRRSR